MGINDLNNAVLTDQKNSITNFEISAGENTGKDLEYTTDWTKWLGFYEIPNLQSIINKKAVWTVGSGYTTDNSTNKLLSKIKGNGKETFLTILYKIVKIYTIGGDFFGEIILKNKKLYNIKTLNPGRVKIITDKFGFIKRYDYMGKNGKRLTSWKPDKILHIMYNPIGDNTHGTSTIQKLTKDNQNRKGIIEMHQEIKQDLQIIFHRYAKPLLISSVDSDDMAEIEKYKTKLDNALKLGENLIIPKGTVENIEKISIPQYSTLDPIPWLKHLESEFIKAEGVPNIILGGTDKNTAGTSNILYLAFEQVIKWNQLFLQEHLKTQLNIDIKLIFPHSLMNNIKSNIDKTKINNNQQPGKLNPNSILK